MEVITNISAEAIRRYFNILIKLGYKNYEDVYKIIVLTYLEELLSDNFSLYITEKDYDDIMKVFYQLLGSNCLIDFPSYATYDKLFKNRYDDVTPRLDGNGIFRVCEDSIIRVKM